MGNEARVLLLIDGLELDSVVCVLPPACRASAVEVFFNVMPTETTDLSVGPTLVIAEGLGWEEEPNLITTRAGSEVQVRYIHLLETERTLLVFLVSIKPGKISGCMETGHQRARRASTYRFVVAPIRVLYACEDARFGLYRCGTGLENRGG